MREFVLLEPTAPAAIPVPEPVEQVRAPTCGLVLLGLFAAATALWLAVFAIALGLGSGLR